MTKILVVEQDIRVKKMIELMMKKGGLETEIAYDGSNFLEKIDVFQPDIVTLDVMMPGLTTKEILEKLKEKSCNPKIILLTVIRYSKKEKKKIMNMGNVVDYLRFIRITKPFEIDNLSNKIKKSLETNH